MEKLRSIELRSDEQKLKEIELLPTHQGGVLFSSLQEEIIDYKKCVRRFYELIGKDQNTWNHKQVSFENLNREGIPAPKSFVLFTGH